MNQWIADYVKGCATCQQNKIITHKKKIPLFRITTDERTLPFQQVAMDLITGLPMHKGKDAILTIVDHGDGYMSLYGHNERLYKAVGERVAAGDAIASAGDSGGSSRPELYFEIRKGGKPVDPRPWFKAGEP